MGKIDNKKKDELTMQARGEVRHGQGNVKLMLRQGQKKVKTRSGHGQGKFNVKLRQSNHNHTHNYNFMGFDTIEINLVHCLLSFFLIS